MPPAPRRQRRATPAQNHSNVSARVQLEYIDITELQPYDFNPRQNAGAVDSLANSIRSFGFLIPVVVDADNIVS